MPKTLTVVAAVLLLSAACAPPDAPIDTSPGDTDAALPFIRMVHPEPTTVLEVDPTFLGLDPARCWRERTTLS